MKAIRERDIERYLVAKVKQAGGEVRKVKWIGRRGAPDRVAMVPSHSPTAGEVDAFLAETNPKASRTWARASLYRPRVFAWVELKAPGKKPEPHQEREHARMRAMGQRVEVIDSFEGVDKLCE